MVKSSVLLLAALLVISLFAAPSAVVTANVASNSTAIVTPNTKITNLNSEVTFTPYSVYVRDGIYIKANNQSLSYVLLEVPQGTHPAFYDYQGYLNTTFKGNIANITLRTPLYPNESWEIYASYTFASPSLLLSSFNYRVWLYNATIGNVTVFAYSPALHVSGVPKGWGITTYKGITHQEVYINGTDAQQSEVQDLIISGYQTGLTFTDFILTFVIIAFAAVDGGLYYVYKKRSRRLIPKEEGVQISERVIDEISAVSDLVKSILDSRKQLPIKKGDVSAVNRWVASARQRLGASEGKLDSLSARLIKKDDVAAAKAARDYLQMIIVDMNNLFELDSRYASNKISEKSYEGIEKQRLRSIFKNLERINELLNKRRSEEE